MRVPIVNEKDEIIEYKDWKDRGLKEIVRVSGLWIVDGNGNILLAQRSKNKTHDPGKWGPAVAGTVEEGETYESNIVKEAEEEIGLKEVKPKAMYKLRRSTSHEYFAQSFIATVDHNYPFKKQDKEVDELRWFTKEEIKKLLKEKPEIFIKSFEEHVNKFFYDPKS